LVATLAVRKAAAPLATLASIRRDHLDRRAFAPTHRTGLSYIF
jgi:hypothetical protein